MEFVAFFFWFILGALHLSTLRDLSLSTSLLQLQEKEACDGTTVAARPELRRASEGCDKRFWEA